MANDLTQNKILQGLDWAYEKATTRSVGLDSAEDLADLVAFMRSLAQ